VYEKGSLVINVNVVSVTLSAVRPSWVSGNSKRKKELD